MVVIGSVADHQIGLPLADEPAEGPAIIHGHHELAIVDVQDLRRRAQDLRALHDFGGAAPGERPSGHGPVSDVAVGAGNKLDVMPIRGPLGRSPSRRDLAVVRMCAEANDAQFAIVGWQRAPFDGRRRS